MLLPQNQRSDIGRVQCAQQVWGNIWKASVGISWLCTKWLNHNNMSDNVHLVFVGVLCGTDEYTRDTVIVCRYDAKRL
jgi:hypothetical protein